jgi:hypothetical protein
MPIERQYVLLHKYIPLMETTAHAVASSVFRNKLIHHINYFMSKRAKK